MTVPNNGTPPGATYNAVVNAGQVTLDQAITLQQLTFGGGTITGPNSLTMNALTTWSAGTFAGAGAVNANGGVTFSGATTKILSGTRTLTLGGPASTWSAGPIYVDGGATLANAAGSVLTATGNDVLWFNSTQGGVFSNAGTFRKQNAAAAGVTELRAGLVFNNSGAVEVNTGTLRVIGGGTSTGTFAVANGATLDFAGAYALTGGAGVSGAGNVTFSAGTVDVAAPYALTGTTTIGSGGRANFNTAATVPNLALSGTLGGTAALTLPNVFTWSGGTLTGSGAVNANGGVVFSGASTKILWAVRLPARPPWPR
jgi:hypothetical protein